MANDRRARRERARRREADESRFGRIFDQKDDTPAEAIPNYIKEEKNKRAFYRPISQAGGGA